MNILVDSNFVYAVYDKRDKYHEAAANWGRRNSNTLILPDVALGEGVYLVKRSGGIFAAITFLRIIATSQLQLVSVTKPDLSRVSDIMAAYPKSNFDFVDTVIMALSERLNITQVCTFDRRDFSIFRPKHAEYLELLP